MAYLIQRVYTRPSTDVKFFGNASQENANKKIQTQQLVETYKANGQLLSESNSLSTDRLTITYSALWSSKEAYDAYRTSSQISQFHQDRKAYNESNGITTTHSETAV